MYLAQTPSKSKRFLFTIFASQEKINEEIGQKPCLPIHILM
jgi:hypothetical protein